MKIRTLHINEQEWKYSVGTKSCPVWSPDGEKTVVEVKRLPGYHKWLAEQEDSFGFSDAFRVTPGKVKAYIEQVILK